MSHTISLHLAEQNMDLSDDSLLNGITMIDNRALLSPSRSTQEKKSPFKESLLMFFAAVGCTICYTSVLSNLVYYTMTMGVESYLVLNLTIYGSMLPTTISQTIWDSKFDRVIGSLGAYSFRGCIGFSVSAICLLLMPFITRLSTLLLVSLMLGLASAILHGMLKQMASFIYPGCGRLAAAVAAGMQASAIPVLFISLETGFGRDSRSEGITKYYFTVAGILLLCWLCFQILVTRSPGVSMGMERQDSLLLEENQDISEVIVSRHSFHSAEDTSQISEEEVNEPEELSLWLLWNKTRPACLVLILTVASSMSVASWLNRVKSQNPSNEAFAQVLFYARLFGDLLGRPATLYRAPTSMPRLTIAAILRLLFVPVFFLYTNSNIIPKWDFGAICGIFTFAFTSGYLSTLSYQLAPSLLEDNERERNLTRQNGLINVCFSSSILMGFALTFVIDFVSN